MPLTASVRAALLVVLLVIVTGFSSCSSEAESHVIEVRPHRAVELIGSGSVTVFDVRSPRAFEAGHVEGAQNLPFASGGFKDRIADLDQDQRYLVYSRDGELARRAAQAMVTAGVETVYDGGAFGILAFAGAPLADAR
jgi:rhodanese-related sulfurtransferase